MRELCAKGSLTENGERRRAMNYRMNSANNSAACESKTAQNHCASSYFTIFADACGVSFFVIFNDIIRVINLALIRLLNAVISDLNSGKSTKTLVY